MTNTLVVVQSDGSKLELDIINGQPITANFNFKDITDLKTKGSHTYNFRLPSSYTNDKFFATYFMVGSFTDTTNNNFNPYTKLEAYILLDTIEVFSGYIQLTNVYLRSGNRYEYEVILFDNSVNLADDLKKMLISDIDFTDYNHSASFTNVLASWSNSIANGDVIYSLWDYGNGFASSLSSDFFTTNFNLGQYTHIDFTKLRPQVRLIALINKMLGHIGYKYTSAFFDSDLFAKIYVDANYNGSDTLVSNTPNAYYQVIAVNNSTQTFNYGDFNVILNTPTENQDSSSSFNPSTNVFTVPYTGVYSFTITFDIAFTGGSQTNAPIQVIIAQDVPSSNNVITQTLAGNEVNVGGGFAFVSISTADLDANQPIQVIITTPTQNDYPQGEELAITNAYLKIDLVQAPNTGGVVSFSSLYGGLKALDFFQSVVKKFNLTVIPDPNDPKHLYIEPYDDYMNAGGSKDWTQKVDFTKDVQIVPPSKFSGKSVKFEDTPSEDYIYQSFKGLPYTYGQFEQNLNNEFTTKSNEFTSIFSPTINYPLPNALVYTSPIFKAEGDGFKNVGGIRLSFYHGTKTLANNIKFKFTPAGGLEYSTFPFFSEFSETDFINSDTVFSINWGCTLSSPLLSTEDVPLFGLARKYWLSYIENNYDKNARMLVAHLRLSPRDISDFNFNDIISINGEEYIVNSIKNYPVSSTGTCKVELLKTLKLFGQFPNIEFCSAQTFVVGINTEIQYFGAPPTSLDEECCDYFSNTFGFGTFAFGKCYMTAPSSNPNEPLPDDGATPAARASIGSNVRGSNNELLTKKALIVQGSNNKIVNADREVKIYGNNNEVKAQTKKIDITGDDNIINERVNDVTIIGVGNEIIPAKDNIDVNGERVVYANTLKNINITGNYAQALNNNEVIISTATENAEGTSQTVTNVIEIETAGGARDAFIGQLGVFSFPDNINYNTDLARNAFRLPRKSRVNMRVTLQATTASNINTVTSEYWNEVNEYELIVGTAPILVSSNQVSSDQSTQFNSASIELQPVSNIPYIYQAYIFKLRLPFSTLVNDSKYIIKTEYTNSILSGTQTSNILPSDITGLTLWLDASNRSSISFNSTAANAQPVNGWDDLSGNNLDVRQTSLTYMPRYYTGETTSGRPYLDFDGSTSILVSNNSTLLNLASTDNTFIAVFESDVTSSESFGQIVAGINTSSGFPRAGIAVNANGTYGGGGNDSVSYYNENTGTNMYQCHISSAGVTDPKIVIGRRSGSNLNIIDENGNTDTYTTASSPTDAAWFSVGGRWTGSIDFAEFNGKIHEIIVYNDNITDTEREQLIFYLKNKWNIQ